MSVFAKLPGCRQSILGSSVGFVVIHVIDAFIINISVVDSSIIVIAAEHVVHIVSDIVSGSVNIVAQIVVLGVIVVHPIVYSGCIVVGIVIVTPAAGHNKG